MSDKDERKLLEKYQELIYAVACAFPNETRHQTALRYIQERENREVACGSEKQALAAIDKLKEKGK